MVNPAEAILSTKSLAPLPSFPSGRELIWQITPALLPSSSASGLSALRLITIAESLSIFIVPRLPSSSTASSRGIGNVGNVAHASSGNLSEATEALMVLGYDRSSVIKALAGIDPTLDVGAIIKAALKKLAG